MASITKRNTFVPGEAKSAEVNQNFDDILDFLNNKVVHVDGAKAMTAPLALPNVDPTADNQAARKAYVDSVAKGRLGTLGGGWTGYAGGGIDPSAHQLMYAAETRTLTTSLGGDVTITFPTPFPSQVITVVPSNGDGAAVGSVFMAVMSVNQAQAVVRVFDKNGNPLISTGVRVNYFAVGF